MVNGLGVVGWGVGGIEAEAVVLGQPYYMLLPEVVGMKFSGALPEGATATDLVLRVTEMLRQHGVVGRFVEYYGAGLSNLYSMYSTTDSPGYLGWFFGTPWDNEEIYRRLSPIRHVKNVTADILIMHGANDARVPPEQAVEFYQALRDLGKTVTYVSYPRQGHGIGEPRLQLDRLRRYVCAFTDAVGMDASTESCADGVPTVPTPESEAESSETAAMAGSQRPVCADCGLEEGIFRTGADHLPQFA